MSPHSRTVRFLDEAQLDLEEILAYTQVEWGSHRRAELRQTLMRSIRTLAASPLIGKVRDDLAPGLRNHPVGSHIVYYSVTNDELRIWRVLHERHSTSRIGRSRSGEIEP